MLIDLSTAAARLALALLLGAVIGIERIDACGRGQAFGLRLKPARWWQRHVRQ